MQRITLIAIAAGFALNATVPARADSQQPRALQEPAVVVPVNGDELPAEDPVERYPYQFVVGPDGMSIDDIRSEEDQSFPFGSPMQAVIAATQEHRGAAEERSVNEECPAGAVEFVTWSDGLMLTFQEENFAGWMLRRDGDTGIFTQEGIGPGATRAQIEAAFPGAEVAESSLGTEFYTGTREVAGISGLLDGSGPEAALAALWAGVACVFR